MQKRHECGAWDSRRLSEELRVRWKTFQESIHVIDLGRIFIQHLFNHFYHCFVMWFLCPRPAIRFLVEEKPYCFCGYLFRRNAEGISKNLFCNGESLISMHVHALFFCVFIVFFERFLPLGPVIFERYIREF